MKATNSQVPAAAPVSRGPKKTPADITLAEFIAAIFGDLPDDELVLLAKEPALGKGLWNTTDLDEAQGWLDHKGRKTSGSSVYFNISTVIAPAEGEKPRRRKQDCVRVRCVVFDDIGTKVDDTEVRPSWVMETSAGSFQYGYIFDEPVERAEHPLFEAFVKEAGVRELTDPGAVGVTRLMRVPGSINIKVGKNRWVSRLVEWHPERRWTFRGLAEAFGIDLDLDAAPTRPAARAAVAGSVAQHLDPVMGWLTGRGDVRGTPDARGFTPIVCPWGDEHTTGSELAGYSALGDGGAEYEQGRQFKCFHSHEKKTREFLDWVEEQGGPAVGADGRLELLQWNTVYIEKGAGFVDMREWRAGRDPMRNEREFAAANAGKIPVPGGPKNGTPIKTAFLTSKNTVRCRASTYLPSIDPTPLIQTPDGAQLFNRYSPPRWPETNEEPKVFLEHVAYLLPDPVEREYFLGWLAHKIQNPAERGVGIIMHTPTFGIGRSWLGSFFERMLPGQVRNADIQQLAGGNGGGAQVYNDLFAYVQYVVVDETLADDPKINSRAYENIKKVVDTSPTSMRVNAKYDKMVETELFFNLLAFSNNLDALHLPEGDRRFSVFTNPTEKHPGGPAYYKRLYEARDRDEPQRAYWWLRRHDWSAVDPRVPLDTAAKRTMTALTMSPADALMQAMRDDGDMRPFMTRRQLSEAAMRRAHDISQGGEASSAGVIDRAVKFLWAEMDQAPWRARETDSRFRPRIEGKPQEVRRWRNNTEWPHESADWQTIVTGGSTLAAVVSDSESQFPKIQK